MPNSEEINVFLAALKNFDWFYQYSDDHSVWRRGNEGYKTLEQQAKRNPVFADLMAAYARLHYNNDGDWKKAHERYHEEYVNILLKHSTETSCSQ